MSVDIEGDVKAFAVGGEVVAEGANSDAIHARGDIRGLEAVRARSIQGHDLVRAD